jgi:hypothetical protein
MGLNNEYGYDAFQGNNYDYDEDWDDDPDDLDEESWQDWHSEHLLNMWMSLRQYTEENYINSSILNKATYPRFVEFVIRNSG